MKTYYVTAYPYASQTGTIKIPGNLSHKEVEQYISDHFDEIDFGEPSLDYAGTDFDFDCETDFADTPY